MRTTEEQSLKVLMLYWFLSPEEINVFFKLMLR